MAEYNIQMGQRNSVNTEWDNHYPITKAYNVKMEDGSDVETALAQIIPKRYISGGQLENLKYSLSNPLEQYVGIVFIGDSITWGMDLLENPDITPRDGTLSDVRDLFVSPSFVNEFKRYIGSKYTFNSNPVLSNWAASPSGESIVEYSKEHVMFPYGGDFINDYVDSVNNPPIITTSSQSLAGMQMSLNVHSSQNGNHRLAFNFTGNEFTLVYASVTGSMKYELFVDGVSQGIFDTAIGVDGNVSGYNNQRTHSFTYGKDKLVEIKTVLGDYVGINTLKIDGIKFNKKIRISNQGIIGTSALYYKSRNLDGNTNGDGDAVQTDDRYVFIQLGTNDRIIINGVAKGTNEFKKNLTDLVSFIETEHDVILMCANPAANENPATYSFNMQEVRNTIYQVSKEKNIDFIDNYSVFGDIPIETYTADGLHPNSLGHKIISRNIINSIEFN